MLHVFCDRKGSGKTKAFIAYANEEISSSKWNVVYVDDDNGPRLHLDRRIRFISTEEYELKDCNNFYGFLCGILSQDYDIGTIYIDGLFNMVDGTIDDAAHLFSRIDKLSQKHNVNFYLNINFEKDIIPEGIKKYVA